VGYRGKLAEQERARELRALGWTMPDIAAELRVSRGSVSLWTRDVPFEPRPRARARQRVPNALQRAKEAEIGRLLAEGRERIGSLSDRDLLIAGTALYAGEGFKRDGTVGMANTDPRILRTFLRWLRISFEIDEARLRVRLYLHEGLDLAAAEAFWSELTAIPVNQFRQPYRASPDASRRSAKHLMGCPAVTYSCSKTHRAVMGLLDALLV
jgi:transcriptional regulator with XRE-family HTH domain